MIKKKSEREFLEIDLTGPDGNAFVLLGYAKGLCRSLKIDYVEVKKEMISGDYESLVSTFERYFGEYVILYR